MTARTQRLSHAIALTAAAGLLIGLWWITRPEVRWGVSRFTAYLLERANSAPDQEAIRAVRELAELGEPGTAALVTVVNVPRAPVARAASDALLDRIEAWQFERETAAGTVPHQARQEIETLACALADSVDEFGPEARRVASCLALRLLTLSGHSPTAGRDRLITNCERVLDIAGISDSVSSFGPSPAGTVRSDPGLSTPTMRLSASGQPGTARLAPLSGGGLPLEVPGLEIPESQRPGSFDPPDRFRPSDRLAVRPLPSGPMGEDTFRAQWRSWHRPIHNAVAAEPSLGNTAVPRQTVRDESKTVVNGSTLHHIMQNLHARNRAVALAAARELLARGFSEIEVALARKLTSPETAVRRQLVEELLQTPGIDGRPWLFWLAEDTDADVRLAALTLLATTTDPATQRRVQELASRDRDRRITALAERIGGLGR